MDYELIEKQVIYESGRLRFELHHLMAEGIRYRKEVIVHPGAVVIVPLLSRDRVLLIRNRRYALNQILIELPAGTMDKGEDPMNCAGRELLEETGYLAGRLKPVCSFYASPGVLTEKLHVFLAYDLQERRQSLDVGEQIELLPVDLKAAIEMVRTGEITDAKTISALLMYERFYRS